MQTKEQQLTEKLRRNIDELNAIQAKLEQLRNASVRVFSLTKAEMMLNGRVSAAVRDDSTGKEYTGVLVMLNTEKGTVDPK